MKLLKSVIELPKVNKEIQLWNIIVCVSSQATVSYCRTVTRDGPVVGGGPVAGWLGWGHGSTYEHPLAKGRIQRAGMGDCLSQPMKFGMKFILRRDWVDHGTNVAMSPARL